jgi:hypothetical protein
MYARVTMLEIDTARLSVESALKTYVDEVLPDVRSQPGYDGIYMLSTPEGKGLVITLWDDEQAAEASSPVGFYADVLEQFVTFFKSPPGRDRYRVDYMEVPVPAAI